MYFKYITFVDLHVAAVQEIHGGLIRQCIATFPVAQMVEHGASNAKIMGSIPRESKS